MGPDVLFENHTIGEIQEIEKKLRNDIERKKEELRQMVGERYRDLMEAADTITEMKYIAEGVTSCVKTIESSCIGLQKSNLQYGMLNSVKEQVKRKKKVNEKLYTITSQLKILMDSPSKIWAFIEDKNYVSAVSLFLLSRHIHSLLVLDPDYHQQNITAVFPIINRQWTSISQFKHVLLQSYQTILKTQIAEPEDILGPLCCRCLLSTVTLKEVFLEVLDTRKTTLKAVFQPEKYAKSQICEFVSLLQLTLKILHNLFYPDSQSNSETGYKTNLLYHTLLKITSKDDPGPVSMLDLSSSAIFKYLPSLVTDFRPIVSDLKECESEFIENNCNKWLDDIQSSSHSELKDLLNYVNSVQSLSHIRESVFEKICEIKNWETICLDLLKKPFSIWDSFLKKCFWQRIENILNDRIKSASDSCQKNTEEVLHKIGLDTNELKYEKNSSLYIWMESPEDIADNIAWIPRYHRTHWSSGHLSMKAMGFTPKVQSISKALDGQLQSTLVDASFFSQLQQIESKFKANAYHKLSADASEIYKYLAQAIEKNTFELLSYLETTLMYLEKEADSAENNKRIIFLGHLCHGIANLCPHINVGLSVDKLSEYIERCQRQEVDINFSSVTFKETDRWKDVKKKLLEIASSAFKLWSQRQIQEVLIEIEANIVTGSAENILKILLQWDKIEIEEESEQGKTVNSVLRIPQHISTPISSALFSLCLKLNAIGGFSISSDVRSNLSQELLSGVLGVYRKKVDEADPNFRLLQVESLQLLFDVQYLMNLLGHKASDPTCPGWDIVEKCVSRVDPFDMDVFAAPLQQNIKKALQRSLSMFGLLASPDQMSSIKSMPVGSQMDHNIMLLSNSGGRFPLLPLSSRTVTQEPVQEKEVKNLQSHSSSPNLSASDIPNNPMKSAASFYDRVTAMSSSWFGN